MLVNSLMSSDLCSLYIKRLKKKCLVFSILPELYNGESGMLFRNRPLFNEPHLVCKICDILLPVR